MNRELLSERDFRIYEMRRMGRSTHDIAKAFGITTRAVQTATERQLAKLTREATLGGADLLRLELERLDALQQAIWPLTQHRQVRLDDGTTIRLEPDLKAVAEVRALMAQRAKLLGMEHVAVNLNLGTPTTNDQRAALAGAEKPAEVNAFNPETEARQLLEIMGIAGVLPEAMVQELLGTTPALTTPDSPDDDIIDADIIPDADTGILYPDEILP